MSFGPCVFILYSLKTFIFRKDLGIGKRLHYMFYESVKNVLWHKYRYIYTQYDSIDTNRIENISREDTIWVFWWQGYSDIPENVRVCINSIKSNSKKHCVVLVDKYNIHRYLDLPELYYEKLKTGKFNLTHFSDIVRVNLLNKYGGIWFDASIILTNSIDEDVYSYKFYTVKHGLYSDYHVSKGLWACFAIFSGKSNPLFSLLSELFNSYWRDHDFLVCYLLIDAFIAIAYEKLPWVKNMIDSVPYNNQNIFTLNEYGNGQSNLISKVGNNYIHKIQFKKKFNFDETLIGGLTMPYRDLQ